MLQGWNMVKIISGNIPIGQCQVCTGNLEGWQYVYNYKTYKVKNSYDCEWQWYLREAKEKSMSICNQKAT